MPYFFCCARPILTAGCFGLKLLQESSRKSAKRISGERAKSSTHMWGPGSKDPCSLFLLNVIAKHKPQYTKRHHLNTCEIRLS